jgi:hypothetical protein
MKLLYEFEVPKEEIVNEVEKQKDEATGQDITITRPVKKFVPHKFALRQPNRAMRDEADLFYSVNLSKFIKGGLLTRGQLAAKFSNEGEILSEKAKEKYGALYKEYYESEAAFQKISAKPEAERTPEETAELEEIKKRIGVLRNELHEFELNQSSLFDHTAEVRARNKTILWWFFHISMQQTPKGWKPFFGEGDYEKKQEFYDSIVEGNDVFAQEVSRQLLYFTSFWFMGRAESQEDFEVLANMLKVEEPKTEDATASS